MPCGSVPVVGMVTSVKTPVDVSNKPILLPEASVKYTKLPETAIPTGSELLVGIVHSVKFEAGAGGMRPDRERSMTERSRKATMCLVDTLLMKRLPISSVT